jgi:glutathione S-transferase
MNVTEKPYVFHAFEVSFFSAKVRPALRYKQLYYEEVRADIREILRRTGMAFIPVVITPEDETWQDSSEILDRLEARYPNPPLYPETPLQRIVCALVELYCDEFGITLAMHTRWGTPEAEGFARARFGAMTGSIEQGNKAADQMVKLRFTVGATEEAGPAIQAHLEELLRVLSVHFDAHDYLFGERMSLADCALMGPCHGHFFTDLASRRLLHETAIPVIRWIEHCNVPTVERQGEWFPADGIPESLTAILEVMGKDAVAPILAAVAEFERYADEHAVAGEDVPRSVGVAESALRGTPLHRGVQSYSLWMLQRVLDPYRSLPESDRARIDEALAGTGWEPLLAYRPRHRIEKKGFGLVYAPAPAPAPVPAQASEHASGHA